MIAQEIRKDVVIIGAGLAGMIAALEAVKSHAHVLLVDKGGIGVGTNSALSNGIFAGPTSNYTKEEYIRDTLAAGKGLSRVSYVNFVANKTLAAISLLRSLGIELIEFKGGYSIRSPAHDHIRGLTLVKVLKSQIKKKHKLEMLNGFYITEILKDGGKINGVKGIYKNAEEIIVDAPAVIIAAGGGGAVFLRNDNQKGAKGQGYYLAAKTGLNLWDMEFVQFYPFVITQEGLPSMLVYPPYPKEVKLLNAEGENILEEHGIKDINEAVSVERDKLSAILFQEGLKGPVYMDYRKVPASLWEKRPLSLLPRRFDFRGKPFEISPAAHFFMGGVHIDERGQTSLPGLFACGEMVWGLHGANRMRGNALTECLVSGAVAGRSAAEYSFEHGSRRIGKEGKPSGRFHNVAKCMKVRDLTNRLKQIAWEHAGIVRTDERLKKGLEELTNIRGLIKEAEPGTLSDIKELEDLKSIVFILQSVFMASLFRRESRGAFIRSDFPKMDNINWRKSSCVAYDREKDMITVKFRQVK